MASHLRTARPPAISEKLREVLQHVPLPEQDLIAAQIARWLEEDDRRWDVAFADKSKLEKLRNEALEEYASGKAQILDLDKL
jgi:hypothetical protein